LARTRSGGEHATARRPKRTLQTCEIDRHAVGLERRDVRVERMRERHGFEVRSHGDHGAYPREVLERRLGLGAALSIRKDHAPDRNPVLVEAYELPVKAHWSFPLCAEAERRVLRIPIDVEPHE